MMKQDEKKMTDEEIVKALECCAMISVNPRTRGECTECPYFQNRIDCVSGKRSEIDTLDLIHRLQDKIAEYERKFDDGELVSKDWHDEQVLHDKAEIERLKTELSESRSVINTAHYKYHDYKDYQAYCINELQVQKVELLKANAELQKQVDELKEEMHKIESAENETYMLGFEEGENQAVKYTAKEILDELLDIEVKDEDYEMFFLDVCEKLEKFAQKYGVEVEL